MKNIWAKIKSFVAYMNDGGLWPIIPALGLILFLIISAFFHLNNYYSMQCALSPWYMKVLGLILLTVGGFSIKGSIEEAWHMNSISWALIAFAFIVLGFLSFADFFGPTLMVA